MTTIHQVSYRYKRIRKYHNTSCRSLCGGPQKEGIIEKIRIMSPKKPHSAKRKIAKIRLSTKFNITARIIGQGHNLQSASTVLVRSGRANDLPGVRFTIIKGKLSFNWKENFTRVKSRSKYGIPRED